MEDCTQIGFSSGRGFLKQVYDVPDVSGSSSRGEDFAGFRIKGYEPDAVRLPEHHVRQAGG
jgi:hypothetical protein